MSEMIFKQLRSLEKLSTQSLEALQKAYYLTI